MNENILTKPDHIYIETIHNFGKAYPIGNAFPYTKEKEYYLIIDEYIRNNMQDKNILIRDDTGYTAFYPAEYFKLKQ